MSDSHGDHAIVEEIKNKYIDEASAFIHCGDSEVDSSDSLWQGVTVVRGNCDFDTGYPQLARLRLDNKEMLVTHGHLYGVNFGLDRLDFLAQEKLADIVFFGHLHTPIVEYKDGRLYVNPGSISQPRGQHQEKMYCKIDFKEDGYHINYLDRKHKEIKDLEFYINYD